MRKQQEWVEIFLCTELPGLNARPTDVRTPLMLGVVAGGPRFDSSSFALCSCVMLAQDLALSPDGSMLLTGSDDNTAKVFSTAGGSAAS